MPNLPTYIVSTNIAWLKLSGKFPMGLGVQPLSIKIVLESNPQKSSMLVGGLGVYYSSAPRQDSHFSLVLRALKARPPPSIFVMRTK